MPAATTTDSSAARASTVAITSPLIGSSHCVSSSTIATPLGLASEEIAQCTA